MRALKKHSIQSLPNDPVALKVIIATQAKRIATLEEYVALDKFKKYGASSEKSPDQQEMFNEVELTVVAEMGYHSFSEAKSEIINYIIGYYSQVRPHRHNDGLAPNVAEQKYWSVHNTVANIT